MNDPAFLFYPGDYLRDTQILSSNVQVAYDRIMCEHMRNICISQKQLNFLTKRLTTEEIEELLMVLTKVADGYQIGWVAESIEKRRKYSESRRKNREGKKKTYDKDVLTHDKHMENENEIENINKDEIEFDTFWDSYHSITGKQKTDKSPAIKKWNKLKDVDKKKALTNILPYFNSLNDAKFCKKARTYLEDRNFEDEFDNKNDQLLNAFGYKSS